MVFARLLRFGGPVARRLHTGLPRGVRPLQARFPISAIPVAIGTLVAAECYHYWSSETAQRDGPIESLPVPPGRPQPSLFKKNPVHALSLDQAEAKLIAGESNDRLGDVVFHTYRLNSNHPIEDQHVYDSRPSLGGSNWHYWGVFDGHAGWATSSLLKDTLVPLVAQALQKTQKADLLSTIKQTFISLDQNIMDKALAFLEDRPGTLTQGISAVAPAIAGSCALLAMFDPAESVLRVANVGDSRAVLGRYDESTGKYVVVKLSEDQTGFNEKEVARIKALHPGEDQILDPKSGRLMGLAITRAFGDHRWKWSVDQINTAKQKYRGPSPRPQTKTPPYLTVEPEITETEVRRGARGDFVIMASDGLWDNISNEDAIECIERWLTTPAHLRKNRASQSESDGGSTWKKNALSWMATPEFFVVENENAATHLAKNAFGGSRRDLFCAVMSAYPPLSRSVRDDITIQVIFFGDRV